MNWDDVRIFLAVARSGQILAASKRLGLKIDGWHINGKRKYERVFIISSAEE